MKSFIAAMVGGLCGFLQLVVISMIEYENDKEKSGFLASDGAYAIFAILVMTEIICVMSYSIYRVAPWVARLLDDKWEADRITLAKKRYGYILQGTTVLATVLRRVVVMVDSGSYSSSLVLSLMVALAFFIIPKPRNKYANQTVQRTAATPPSLT